MIAAARGKEKIAFLKSLGAHAVINTASEDLKAAVKKVAPGGRVCLPKFGTCKQIRALILC